MILINGTIDLFNNRVPKLWIGIPLGTNDKSGPDLSNTIKVTWWFWLCSSVSRLRTTRSAPPPEKRGRTKIIKLFFNYLTVTYICHAYYSNVVVKKN